MSFVTGIVISGSIKGVRRRGIDFPEKAIHTYQKCYQNRENQFYLLFLFQHTYLRKHRKKK